MARRIRSAALETRSNRRKFAVRKKPYAFTPIAPGISLGYRRCQGPGRWVVKVADGHGGSWIKNVGIADDHEESDGEHVLDFWTAQERARKLARGQDGDSGRPATLREAITDYARDLEKRDGLEGNISRALHHLTPALLDQPITLLTAKELKRWRNSLAGKPATINRTVKVVKAVLNFAADHDPRISNREAWRVGLAGLPDAVVARNVVLPEQGVRALISGGYAVDQQTGLLIETAAITGARPVQLRRLVIADLQDSSDTPRLMMPSSRKGKSSKRIERRPVPIPASLAAKLHAVAGDRPPGDRLLLKADGTPWERDQHTRPIRKAVAHAGLAGHTIYSLRHSSIARDLIAGVPTKVTADKHDTSEAMIRQHYGRFVSDHSDAVARRALFDPSQPSMVALV